MSFSAAITRSPIPFDAQAGADAAEPFAALPTEMRDDSFRTVPEVLARGSPENTFWTNPGGPGWVEQQVRTEY